LRNGALTIGNFDGCHLGHMNLIKQVKTYSQGPGHPKMVMTFDPNPKILFGKLPSQNGLLFTKEQKVRAFEGLGFDGMIMQKFDQAFRGTSHEAFVDLMLHENLNVNTVVVGENFSFGKNRLGDIDYLTQKAHQHGFNLVVESSLLFDNLPISSHRIRTELTAGDVAISTKMLGRPYSIEGVIGHGDKVGRRIGVPTANLQKVEQLIPKPGVYAGYIWYQGGSKDPLPTPLALSKTAKKAVINIGYRPTLDQTMPQMVIEGHILSTSIGPDELYNKKAIFYFAHRLRDEKKFGSLAELKGQIDRDIATATDVLANRVV
jgi:riboflavin kinase/FMN adenylyltransferase